LTLIIGTGKSVLLQSIIKELRRKYGRNSVAVTATTGLAAINIGGQTVHSFAGFNYQSKSISVEKLIEEISQRHKVVKRWKKIKALVIDEGMIFLINIIYVYYVPLN
jgi:ATP-dependent DNA helicase PIF1